MHAFGCELEEALVVGLKDISLTDLRQDIRGIRSTSCNPESPTSDLSRRSIHGFSPRSTTDFAQEKQTSQKDAHQYIAFERRRSYAFPLKSVNLRSPQYPSPSTPENPHLYHGQDPMTSDAKLKEDPWSRELVLSLDGGDTRGFQPILVLSQLMGAIRRIEGRDSEPKPCLYFDYIVGTGTGGLLAIMLGRLRMTVNECSEAYQRLIDPVFSHSRRRFFLRSRPKYNSLSLQKAINEVIREYGPACRHRGQEDLFASDPIQCKTAVVSFIVKSGKPYIFRTYGLSNDKGVIGSTRSFGETTLEMDSSLSVRSDMLSRQGEVVHAGFLRIAYAASAASATSASPSQFSPLHMSSQSFVDGGVAANNPSLLICSKLKDVRKEIARVKHKDVSGQDIPHSPELFIDTFVSIGVSKERTSNTQARKDSTRSILRRNKDLWHRLLALTELDTLSSNETDTIMRLLTDTEEISKYFRLVAEPSTSNDWRKHEKGGRGIDVDPVLDEHSCGAVLRTWLT